MRPKSVTQKDIAERVGVSTATVSRALNDQPGVSPDVRARILKAAGEMGYSRNPNAHSLVTSVRHTVAFVVHAAHAAAEDPFYPIEAGNDIATAIPGAELLILDGMGHSFPREVIPRIIDALVANSNKIL